MNARKDSLMRHVKACLWVHGFVLPNVPLLVSAAFSSGPIAKRSPTESTRRDDVDKHTVEAYKPELLYRGDCEFSRALSCSQGQPLRPRACTSGGRPSG